MNVIYLLSTVIKHHKAACTVLGEIFVRLIN